MQDSRLVQNLSEIGPVVAGSQQVDKHGGCENEHNNVTDEDHQTEYFILLQFPFPSVLFSLKHTPATVLV